MSPRVWGALNAHGSSTVAWNTTGSTPASVACIVMTPSVEPSVTFVDATPLASVVVVVGENAAAAVDVALQVTEMPSIGWPFEPSAVKLNGTGSCAPRGAD